MKESELVEKECAAFDAAIRAVYSHHQAERNRLLRQRNKALKLLEEKRKKAYAKLGGFVSKK